MSFISHAVFPEYFEAAQKTQGFRLRHADLEPGDIVELKEFDPLKNKFTGRVLRKTIDLAQAPKLPKIFARGIKKNFGQVRALRGADITVETGSITAILGPNGAGKTTLIRILATLLKPDGGRAQIAGYDVESHAQALRAKIGLAGQTAALDENLTGRENLVMIGRLYHMPAKEAERRAIELLSRFGLTSAMNRAAKTYSGGMRRRLDLASSMIGKPQVLFLDEPTAGLDPQSRNELWRTVKTLAREGITILLTTQYLEEADNLADKVVIIDHGKIIAEDTPAMLKARFGEDILEIDLNEPVMMGLALPVIRSFRAYEPHVEGMRVSVPVKNAGEVAKVIRALDEAGVILHDLSIRRPTMDDVFLALTGHEAERKIAANNNIQTA